MSTSWTPEEDQFLLKHGMSLHASEYEKYLGRSKKQCCQRYQNSIDPRLVRTPITKKEINRFNQLFSLYGNYWVLIGKMILLSNKKFNRMINLNHGDLKYDIAHTNIKKYRSSNFVKNYYHYVIKGRTSRPSRRVARVTPLGLEGIHKSTRPRKNDIFCKEQTNLSKNFLLNYSNSLSLQHEYFMQEEKKNYDVHLAECNRFSLRSRNNFLRQQTIKKEIFLEDNNIISYEFDDLMECQNDKKKYFVSRHNKFISHKHDEFNKQHNARRYNFLLECDNFRSIMYENFVEEQAKLITKYDIIDKQPKNYDFECLCQVVENELLI